MGIKYLLIKVLHSIVVAIIVKLLLKAQVSLLADINWPGSRRHTML
jgi:hypothetical protein